MKQTVQPGKRHGIIHIPPSKSDTQRSLLAAALAKGTSTLRNVGYSNDERHMLDSIQRMGAIALKKEDRTYEITGIQHFPEELTLHVGESGLGIRLLTPVCAAHEGHFQLTGEGTLLTRPMHFFETVFRQTGNEFHTENGYLPFELKGPMQAGNYTVDGSQSSQYISGLLMAFPLINGTTYLTVENLTSIPYLQMTLHTLERFGIRIDHQEFHDFAIGGNQQYLSTELIIESDWSSASYWLVASALGADIHVKGLSLKSLQADKKIIEAFENAQCIIEFEAETISVNGEDRKPFTFNATHCPDLFPALAVFAALTEGTSIISGVDRLAHKESNRGLVIREELAKTGIQVELIGDEMHIHGQKTLKGTTVHSHGDHRIAMCMAIAGLFSDGEMAIDEAEAVGKSYPEFWDDLEKLKMNM